MTMLAAGNQTASFLPRPQLLAGCLIALTVTQPLSGQDKQIARVEKNDHGEPILVLNGTPCFRVGYYMPPGYTAAQLSKMADLHAKAGFNHMHAKRMEIAPSDFERFLMKVEEERIGITYSIGMNLDAVDTFKNSRAIIGWYVDDVQNYEPRVLLTHAKRIRGIDPGRVVDFSGGWRTDLRKVLPAADLYHRQFYPIRKQGDGRNHERMAETYQEAANVVSLGNQFGTVPCMDLQGAYSDSGGEYWPTAEETDVMFYMAITAGVKGVRWCAFGDLEGTPLWKQTCRIVSELNSGLDEAFLLGRRSDHQTSKGVVHGIWEHDNNVYVVVVNATGELSPKLSISLPPDIEAASSLFRHRANSLRLTERRLAGRIPPLSVEIYHGSRSGN